MISDLLKESTRQLHDQTEAKFNSQKIFDATFSLLDYRRLLEYNYLFLLNFEKIVFNKFSPFIAKQLHLPERRKLHLIEKEAQHLNISRTQPDLSVEVKNQAEAFGILYVMEGSTLGGNMIAKQLSKYDEFKNFEFAYFRCYGEKTGFFWKNFKEIMNLEISAENEADCLTGAHKGYDFLLNLP